MKTNYFKISIFMLLFVYISNGVSGWYGSYMYAIPIYAQDLNGDGVTDRINEPVWLEVPAECWNSINMSNGEYLDLEIVYRDSVSVPYWYDPTYLNVIFSENATSGLQFRINISGYCDNCQTNYTVYCNKDYTTIKPPTLKREYYFYEGFETNPSWNTAYLSLDNYWYVNTNARGTGQVQTIYLPKSFVTTNDPGASGNLYFLEFGRTTNTNNPDPQIIAYDNYVPDHCSFKNESGDCTNVTKGFKLKFLMRLPNMESDYPYGHDPNQSVAVWVSGAPKLQNGDCGLTSQDIIIGKYDAYCRLEYGSLSTYYTSYGQKYCEGGGTVRYPFAYPSNSTCWYNTGLSKDNSVMMEDSFLFDRETEEGYDEIRGSQWKVMEISVYNNNTVYALGMSAFPNGLFEDFQALVVNPGSETTYSNDYNKVFRLDEIWMYPESISFNIYPLTTNVYLGALTENPIRVNYNSPLIYELNMYNYTRIVNNLSDINQTELTHQYPNRIQWSSNESDLYLVYNYTDKDGDLINNISVNWYLNNSLILNSIYTFFSKELNYSKISSEDGNYFTFSFNNTLTCQEGNYSVTLSNASLNDEYTFDRNNYSYNALNISSKSYNLTSGFKIGSDISFCIHSIAYIGNASKSKILFEFLGGNGFYPRLNAIIYENNFTNIINDDSYFGEVITNTLENYGITDNRWYYYVLCRDDLNNKMYAYLNGELIANVDNYAVGSFTFNETAVKTVGRSFGQNNELILDEFWIGSYKTSQQIADINKTLFSVTEILHHNSTTPIIKLDKSYFGIGDTIYALSLFCDLYNCTDAISQSVMIVPANYTPPAQNETSETNQTFNFTNPNINCVYPCIFKDNFNYYNYLSKNCWYNSGVSPITVNNTYYSNKSFIYLYHNFGMGLSPNCNIKNEVNKVFTLQFDLKVDKINYDGYYPSIKVMDDSFIPIFEMYIRNISSDKYLVEVLRGDTTTTTNFNYGIGLTNVSSGWKTYKFNVYPSLNSFSFYINDVLYLNQKGFLSTPSSPFGVLNIIPRGNNIFIDNIEISIGEETNITYSDNTSLYFIESDNTLFDWSDFTDLSGRTIDCFKKYNVSVLRNTSKGVQYNVYGFGGSYLFNYSCCDYYPNKINDEISYKKIPKDHICVIKVMSRGMMTSLTNIFFDNYIWVFLIILIIMIALPYTLISIRNHNK